MSDDHGAIGEGKLPSAEDAPAIEDPGTYITEDASPYTDDDHEADRAQSAAHEQSRNAPSA